MFYTGILKYKGALESDAIDGLCSKPLIIATKRCPEYRN
jgi:hypothetical protein